MNRVSDERLVAGLMYFTSFFTAIIGPLVLWFVKRDSLFVQKHGYMYLNFVISYFLYQAAAGFLIVFGIGIVLNVILGVLMIIFTVLAGIKALQGEVYHIPLTIRFFTPS
ncbi:DUF4870 domain-containing protein [Jeotgalibacillus aurantiacus]|uniref:DUF4870 domain-containing protein n=1 Tax=Jeotgalibacillus aurantiacus TaxID=2763266 RepID=UPI001D0B242F|nr:DUF4870 domain-containing protein [Jeotgalibacillus aurantiacus]